MNQFKKTTEKSEKRRGIYFQLGLIIAGSLSLVAFEWTSSITLVDLPDPIDIIEIDIEFPFVLPNDKPKKPEVKFIKPPKQLDVIKLVEEIIEPTSEISPEPIIKTPLQNTVYVEGEFEEPEIISDPIILIPDIMPEFKGGLKEMFKYLGNNLKYPKVERRYGVEGTIHLQFVVGKNGKIKDIKILRGENDAMNTEAIRVLKSMPKWKPGWKDGKPVNVRYMLPIKFLLKG